MSFGGGVKPSYFKENKRNQTAPIKTLSLNMKTILHVVLTPSTNHCVIVSSVAIAFEFVALVLVLPLHSRNSKRAFVDLQVIFSVAFA